MKKLLAALLLAGPLLAGCEKYSNPAPDFTVSADQTTVKAGTTVNFSLSGKVDALLFYSGEAGRNFDLRNNYSQPDGVPEMQFLSTVAAATVPTPTPVPAPTVVGTQNLRVLVSTDFDGKTTTGGGYDSTSVRKATWTDITSRFTLSATASNLSSGVVSLNDFKVAGKLTYVAFRYVSVAPLATNIQRAWTIGTFQVRTRYPSGAVYTNANTNTDSGFSIFNFKGLPNTWVSGGTLTHTAPATTAPADDDWAISKGFDFTKVNSDAAGGIKVKAQGLIDPLPATYSYKYNTPGTYKAVFYGTSGDINSQKELVREVMITVTP
ncbi:hypothetical protein GCM10027594_31880 [Hymenobacter agri]